MVWDPRVGPALSAASDPSAGAPSPAPEPAPTVHPARPAAGAPSTPPGSGHGYADADQTTTYAPPLAPGRSLEPMHGPFGVGRSDPSPWVPTPDAALVPPKRGATEWGSTSLGLSPATAAGVSYLGWWLTGLLIYFHERQNWYVRFHALQSVLYTAALTIVSVAGYVVSSLLMDLSLATRQAVFLTLSRWLAVVTLLAVVLAWLTPLIAAWCGFRLRIPFLAPYAERYAAPVPVEAATPDEL